jgi:hypothetical protein
MRWGCDFTQKGGDKMSALVSISYADSMGRETKRLYELEDQVDLAAYTAQVTALVGSVEDITDLGAVRVDLILKSFVTGFDPIAGSNVDVGATFVGMLAAADGAKASHKVPGFKASLVGVDGTIDITQAVVDTYLDNFLTANAFMLSNGQTIDHWIKGKLDK